MARKIRDKYKVIGGREYIFRKSFNLKSDADRMARNVRERRGRLAMVIPDKRFSNRHGVYTGGRRK